MTYVLDITEGQPEGHALRTCVIGMRVANVLGIAGVQRSDLYYALLLKDLGCSSNSAKVRHLFGADDLRVKRHYKLVDTDDLVQGARFVFANAGTAAPFHRRMVHVVATSLSHGEGQAALTEVRCERGADIARQMGFADATAEAIRALDEHWDGRGYPYRRAGEAIPPLARILCLAQTVEVFFRAGGPQAALAMARARRGRWFDPAVVDAFVTAQERPGFWTTLEDAALHATVTALEPTDRAIPLDEARLDRVAEAFARVIDAKSPWTFRHSERVRRLALGAASQLDGATGAEPDGLLRLSRAALLHDIGKLGVSNVVLDKPGRLDDAELASIRRHPSFGAGILERVTPFRALAEAARSHHERMDGAGYPHGIPASTLPPSVRILAAADQFEALTAARPYRDPMTPEQALAALWAEAGDGVDPVALTALERFLALPEAADLRSPQEPDPAVPLPGGR